MRKNHVFLFVLTLLIMILVSIGTACASEISPLTMPTIRADGTSKTLGTIIVKGDAGAIANDDELIMQLPSQYTWNSNFQGVAIGTSTTASDNNSLASNMVYVPSVNYSAGDANGLTADKLIVTVNSNREIKIKASADQSAIGDFVFYVYLRDIIVDSSATSECVATITGSGGFPNGTVIVAQIGNTSTSSTTTTPVTVTPSTASTTTTTTISGGGGGTATGGGGGGGTTDGPSSIRTVTNATFFDTAKTYAGNYRILVGGTFGPVTATSGDSIITGTLYLNPGADGTVTLRNIQANKIVVESGATNSINLQNVTVTTTLTVSTGAQSNPVRIVTTGTTSITQTVTSCDANLVQTGGSFGAVNITSASAVSLEGIFTSTEIITVSATGAALTAPLGTTLASVVVTAGASINSVGTITNIAVQTTSAVSIGGTGSIGAITFNLATTAIPDSADTIPIATKIIGYDPSTAKDYATKYSRTFESLGSPPDYTYTVTDGKAEITKYTGAGGAVTIPDTLGGYPVTTIGGNSFKWCEGLTSVSVPQSVTSIGDYAFNGCSKLTSINIPDSVTSIGYCTFSDCNSITSITVPQSVTSIGDYAFYSCSKLTSINIPDSVTSIGNYTFAWCGLIGISIPASVINIDKSPFGGCYDLATITVETGNPAYKSEDGVLLNKAKTELIQCPGGKNGSYTIPDNVTSIGDGAFTGCTHLTSINIPDGVTRIGSGAFRGCWGLNSINIPASVTNIGDGAFTENNLTAITVDANNITYASEEGVLFNKAKTELIQYPRCKTGTYTIPASVTSIGSWTFGSCNFLVSISIPDSVTSIASNAFNSCSSLTSITIPKSITSIGNNAFYYCTNLSAAHFYGNAPSMGENVFGGAKSDFTVYYLSDKTGFTNPWYGYPTVVLENIAVTGITINISTTTITAGWYEKITASVLPENAVIKDVIWSVQSESGSNIARISINGFVVAMNPGTALIRATSVADATKYAECSVTVISEPVYDHFNQGEGYEAGAYDPQAQQPMAFNWSRQSAFSGPEYPSKKWEFQVRNSSFRAWFQPVIGSDGTIYAGSDDTKLYAIKPDGTLKWTFTTAGNIQGCPSIGRNGVLYVASGDCLFAIDNNGNEIWRAELGSNSYVSLYRYGSPAIDSDGTIYCMGNSGLYAVSVYGEILWSNKLVRGASSPVIGKDGSIYIATENTLYSIKADGSINWVYNSTADEYSAMDERISTPTIGSDGKIYAVFYGRITAINPDGTEYKKYDAFFDGHSYKVGDSSATPAISNDGSMYLGFKGVAFISYNNSGTIKWANALNHEYYHRSSPVIDKNGVIYVCSMLGQDIGNLYAFNIDGSVKWKFECNTELEGAPAIDADGTVYVGTGNGKIIAIGNNTNGPVQLSDYIYTLSNDNITITGYNGAGGDVEIPALIDGKSVNSIGESAFASCYCLTSISIPASVTSIGNYAFTCCYNLTSISIPTSVISIGKNPFGGSYNLAAITVETGNPAYTSEDGVLFNKAKTELIQCPGGKTGSYTIPSSVTSIGDAGFNGCSNLTSISIPTSVTSIGNYTFACYKLATITVETGNPAYTSEDGVLFNKAKTELIQCPGGKIGSYTIPDSVTSISRGAFELCSSITSIVIPSSVTTIDDWTFCDCSSLSAAYFYGNAPSMTNNYLFGEAKTGFTVYYLSDKTGFTNPWNGYPTAIFSGTIPTTDECFIATAAFGSKFTWPVALLRNFRDQYLLTNTLGTAFVRFYYQYSPPIADFIATSQPLKMLVRVMLAPVIAIVYTMYHPILMAAMLVLLIVFLTYRFRLRGRYVRA